MNRLQRQDHTSLIKIRQLHSELKRNLREVKNDVPVYQDSNFNMRRVTHRNSAGILQQCTAAAKHHA